ncbi:MAG: RNA polymerase sigma factor [Planctomycetota bacterium]
MPPYAISEPHAVPAPATAEGAMLDRYRNGDEAAFEELHRAYYDDAYWAARRLLNDDQTARDIVQEAFIRLMRSMNSYDPHKPFRAWFLRIVHNLAIDHMRRRRHEVVSSEFTPSATVNHGREMEADETTRRVRQVLAALPAKYRRLLQKRELDGQRADAIARDIGVDYQTTRWRIHQARKLFKREWTHRFGPAVN